MNSNLSWMKDDKPHGLYEALFGRPLQRCQKYTPGPDFKFQSRLYSLDAATIDSRLSVFSRADFRGSGKRAKGSPIPCWSDA